MSVIERSNIGRAEFTRSCLKGGDLSVVKDFFRDHKPYFRLSLTEALGIACEMGSLKVIQWVLEESEFFSQSLTIDTFLKSCRKGRLEVVKYMATRFECKLFNSSIEKASWQSEDSWNKMKMNSLPLHNACKSGNLLLVQWLAQQLKEKRWEDRFFHHHDERYLPSVTAIQHNHFHIYEWLAVNGDLDSSHSIRQWAFFDDGDKRDVDEIQYAKIIQSAVAECERPQFIWDSERKKWVTILHNVCCRMMDVNMAGFLIHECHFDPNITDVKNKNGVTPLIACCNQKNFEMAHFLIQNGADVNYTTNCGLTPLIVACMNGNSEMAQFLVEQGANVNQKDDNGVTPIFYACKRAHFSTVKLLLKLGADVNVASKNGKTLLFYAHKAFKKERYFGRTLEIVKTLVKHGADINHEDENGQTALCDALSRSMLWYDVANYYLNLPTIDLVKKNKDGLTIREWAESKGDELNSFVTLIKAREQRLPKLLGFLTERGWWSDDRFRKRDKSVSGLTNEDSSA